MHIHWKKNPSSEIASQNHKIKKKKKILKGKESQIKCKTLVLRNARINNPSKMKRRRITTPWFHREGAEEAGKERRRGNGGIEEEAVESSNCEKRVKG